MKRLFYTLLLVIAGITVHAQSHIRISSISGIPVDSVFEVANYDSIYVTVVNDDTSSFSDSLNIFIKSSSNQFTDNLIPYTYVTLSGGDSTTLNRSGYVFSPQFFSEGDNIVVVWPAAQNVNVVADSISFSVYFVSLIASVPENSNESLILYPNPTTKFISFKGSKEIQVKYVRICDISGKEIYSSKSADRLIPTSDWKPGMYIISIERMDGTIQRFKLEKD